MWDLEDIYKLISVSGITKQKVTPARGRVVRAFSRDEYSQALRYFSKLDLSSVKGKERYIVLEQGELKLVEVPVYKTRGRYG